MFVTTVILNVGIKRQWYEIFDTFTNNSTLFEKSFLPNSIVKYRTGMFGIDSSLIVQDFNISVLGSSCNYLIFFYQSVFFSMFIYSLHSILSWECHKIEIENKEARMKLKKDIDMNCCTVHRHELLYSTQTL